MYVWIQKLMLPNSNTFKLIFVRGSKLSKREVRMSSYKGHAKKKWWAFHTAAPHWQTLLIFLQRSEFNLLQPTLNRAWQVLLKWSPWLRVFLISGWASHQYWITFFWQQISNMKQYLNSWWWNPDRSTNKLWME